MARKAPARKARGKPAKGAGKPTGWKAEERAVAEVEAAPKAIREAARGALGVTGAEEAPPLREGILRAGVGWYPLLALGGLAIVDEFQSYAFFVLGPEISDGLGISRGTIAFSAALKTLAISIAALPIAAYAQRQTRRAAIAVGAALAWAVVTMFTGFVTSVATLVVVLILNGISTASVHAVHRPLLFDSYPPEIRVRLNSAYRMFDGVGNIAAPLLVAVLTAVASFTWRGVFLVMSFISLALAIFAVRLRDPGFGRWDTGEVRKAVRRQRSDEALVEGEISLGFFEIVRRLLLIPSVRRILVAEAVFGMFLIPLQTFVFFFFEERWNMSPAQRGLLFAAFPVVAIPALAFIGSKGDAMFRRDPGGLLQLSALFLALAVVFVVVGVLSPVFAVMAVSFALAVAAFGVLNPLLAVAMLSVVPPRMRPHATALIGIAVAAVGGFGGLVLLQGIDSRFGLSYAIASLALPGILAALVLRTSAPMIGRDLDQFIDGIVEEEKVRELTASGTKLPMLACRNVDFSYGQLQVLFGVSFTVDDGEMVALLGTNGAGKSTLLRVISGLGLPTRGSVRFHGTDITYVDAERRLGLGITQVPGGRAIFRSLSVEENLRLFGFTHGRDRKAVEAGIDATFEAFPRLAERRDVVAGTLSGGEQQMLGLGKAFVLKPRLLLIDELSLGLAPKIVSELLEMVRRINAEGTAVVLVEQSVNIALSLVDHAYFMEKGEIRFDGRAPDLLARKDLLRSVFLEGAARSLRREAATPGGSGGSGGREAARPKASRGGSGGRRVAPPIRKARGSAQES
ncbi:MAG TPA: MFS transporter [Actinomycetota bacterium]|jgi:ABC-type branched-subunit amino acid transport system ATPase component/sugar phosphate permease|nr:MFS transporter [Actinomycetota bacterium]